MRLGKLDKRVSFQVRVSLKDAAGQKQEGWEQIGSMRWASIEPIGGRELLAASQVQGEITHRIRCRFFDGLTAAHRIVFKARVFDIQSVINPRERGVELEILCKEGLTHG